MMCGISGSGKTVFSRALEKHSFIRVSVDEILWEYYGPEFTKLSPDKQRQAFITIGEHLSKRVVQLISDGKKVVVDSTMCKRSKRDEIRKTCRSLGIEPVIVYLKSSYGILHDRLAERRGSGPNDQIVSDTQLRNFYNNFEAPGEDENAIIIEQK